LLNPSADANPGRIDSSNRRGDQVSIWLTRLVNLEIFLEAFFLWIVPFDAVLAITGRVAASAVFASSALPLSMAMLRFFIAVFILERFARLRKRLTCAWRFLFSADL
jgi:hypothetical protein